MSEHLRQSRFLKALKKEPVDMTPVWIMRQAGRYLPEYRQTRTEAGSFMQLCQTPELAAEVTLQPLRRYALDASIIFSDILTIPDAMGLGLHFVTGEGPQFKHPIQTARDIEKLEVPDLKKLAYTYDAIHLVKREIKVPLIGFCGSPFTLAAYMLDGNSKGGFPKLFKMLKEAPDLLQQLLGLLAKAATLHLQAQREAGCDVLMIFDTWGGLLNTPQYHAFSLAHCRTILNNLNDTPSILFTKGGAAWLEDMAALPVSAIGVDWTITLAEARQRVGGKVALQGNLNPATLLEQPEIIQAEVAKTLASYGKGPGHIFNLGHGITPDVDPTHVSVLVDTVHEMSRIYHAT